MPTRAKSICRKTNCTTTISTPGYCDKHKKNEKPFRTLDKKKTPEMKKFYSSYRWTKTSKDQRRREPLCEGCLENGKTKIAEMVHHEPPLQELLRRGLNPFSTEYLHSLCNNCHLVELRCKKKK